MHGKIPRDLFRQLDARLTSVPAVALLGPRQCGKTHLAKQLMIAHPDQALYLDLESPGDRAKLSDPEAFCERYPDHLICLDEIQRIPELFAPLRSIIDRRDRNGQFLILGSASRDLLQQSSESLAGRISYLELTPLLADEWLADPRGQEGGLDTLWLRGGFPRSLLQADGESLAWREDFIRTYLERDIPQLGFRIPAKTLERLWRMLAHSQSQLLNLSQIGLSLGVSHTTVRNYLDILRETFLIRILEPFATNTLKRLVKSPKVYVRDSGLLHALLGVRSLEELLGVPQCGASWEGFVVEQLLGRHPGWHASFYRDSQGSELDLLLERGPHRIAVEIKLSTAPQVTRGFWTALEVVKPSETWLIAPVAEPYPFRNGVTVAPLSALLARLAELAVTD